MKKYVPDIAQHALLCEANYLRLERLLQDQSDAQYQFSWQENGGNRVDVDIQVTERFKYTTTLKLLKQAHSFPAPMDTVELTVRMYSDARMAEVVGVSQGQQLAGVYRYPNEQMYQIDEKQQVNRYLAEWLGHLLTHGTVRELWIPK
ncbi:DUF1249 domain-containing protein [Reinekea sp.]|jgi:uncharacterized protein YqiB (DUF1249 family)|uniref:DUF1249 domain-containing protein n=1 Tax=Reinekea sp. TaxID=1970455 RepID=UPI002A816FAA|nr:DUF1249 domain-containing protein [Reinekea sp.]